MVSVHCDIDVLLPSSRYLRCWNMKLIKVLTHENLCSRAFFDDIYAHEVEQGMAGKNFIFFYSFD